MHLQNEERGQQASAFCMIGEKRERDWRDMEKEILGNRLTQVGEASRDEKGGGLSVGVTNCFLSTQLLLPSM